MHINPIFVDDETGEGLYSAHHDNETQDEYDRLFDFWFDTEEIFKYLKANREAYLETEYFEFETVNSLERKISRESFELQNLLEECGPKTEHKLESFFKPLDDYDYTLPPYQDTKAIIKDKKNFPKPILRIYAVRISENTFVISGGAIKLVKRMEDHADTRKELEKLRITKDFLISNGFKEAEDFKLII